MTSTEADLRDLLATAVRDRRAQLNLSQRQLAKRAGVADATISKLETAQLSPSLDTLAKVTAGLEMDLAELIDLVAPRKGRMRPSYTVDSGSWTAMLHDLATQVVADMGSVQAAADELGIARSTLSRWLNEGEE